MWILIHIILIHINKLGFIHEPYVHALNDLSIKGNMKKITFSDKENSDEKKVVQSLSYFYFGKLYFDKWAV